MRTRLFMAIVLAGATAAATAGGCGAGDLEGASDDGDYPGGASDAGASGTCLASSECPTGYICNEFGSCEPPPTPGDGGITDPPEVEYDIGAPISAQRFVYVAMTAEDELARIDGRTLAVKTTSVGEAPRVVSAIPNSDGAVVLDSVNGTATIVRPTGETDAIRVLPTLHNLNRLDIDPSGRFAVIWFDLVQAIQDGGIGGIGSFQDVTIVKLGPSGYERAVDLTVGFRPRAVKFDAAGNRAYVITQDGVSVIDLAVATTQGPSIVPPIPVADPLVPPDDLEIDIVSTGEYAAVRQAGVPALRIVGVGSLEPGVVRTIPLAPPATAIDLAPDGSRLYVVQRAAKVLSIVDVPGDAVNPAGVQSIDLSAATIGSLVVSASGTRALLYTNATLDERITMIKLDEPGFPQLTWPLKKAVRAVGISPTGDTALILNAKAPGDPATSSDVDDYIDKSYAYTLLYLGTGFSKLQVTPVDPGPFSYALDGSKVYVGLDGGDPLTATRALQIVTTQTGVVVTKQLGSPPEAVGVLPEAGQAFVAQRHPLGRVSFIDVATDKIRTVTGFDLNSQIVE